MRALFLYLCFVATIAALSPVSYGEFSYDLDRLTVKSGTSYLRG